MKLNYLTTLYLHVRCPILPSTLVFVYFVADRGFFAALAFVSVDAALRFAAGVLAPGVFFATGVFSAGTFVNATLVFFAAALAVVFLVGVAFLAAFGVVVLTVFGVAFLEGVAFLAGGAFFAMRQC